MKRMLIVCAILLGFTLSAGAASDIVVIAHKDVKDESLSKDDVQDIYLGKKTKWEDNSEIKPVQYKSGTLHEDFLKDYVNRSRRLYQNHWNKMVFTGQGFPPKSFETYKELIEYIADTPGAVGYVKKGTETDAVKVIEIK